MAKLLIISREVVTPYRSQKAELRMIKIIIPDCRKVRFPEELRKTSDRRRKSAYLQRVCRTDINRKIGRRYGTEENN